MGHRRSAADTFVGLRAKTSVVWQYCTRPPAHLAAGFKLCSAPPHTHPMNSLHSPYRKLLLSFHPRCKGAPCFESTEQERSKSDPKVHAQFRKGPLKILPRMLRILRSKAVHSGSCVQKSCTQDLVSESRALRILCPKAVHPGSCIRNRVC